MKAKILSCYLGIVAVPEASVNVSTGQRCARKFGNTFQLPLMQTVNVNVNVKVDLANQLVFRRST